MISRLLLFGLALTSASLVLAEDLPLPTMEPQSDGSALLKPTISIKPPGAALVAKPESAKELAIIEMERQIIEDQTHRMIAEASRLGNSSALKQIILMNGPVDAAISRAAKPPQAPAGKVSLIGLAKNEVVSKSVESFFGAPMTPESEKALLEMVKTQLVSKEKPNVEVRVAGWWPNEGVMAVSVMPRS